MATLTSSLIVQLIDRATGPARGIGAALARLNGQSSRFNRSQMAGAAMARGFAGRLLALGAGYVGIDQGIRRTVGAAITFEEAFSDVRKVLNASDEQLANIKRQIVDMSRVLPTSTEGLAAIFAAAGQSNVPIEELGKFSEMVAKVAVAWDTSEGATSEALAKIKTQLHLSVGEVGLLADAINYLSNNSAAKAADLVDYEKRIAAMGDMFGFTKEQTLAFGGAMIAAGGETNVAATSFRNMGKALTKGGQATKKQRLAFHQLGLDSVKVAKRMQKDALGTTLDVIERIQKLPEWQRISIASALFGDEARALQPVLANTTELRRQLGLVGDQANYAGSAYQEYLVRADTTANALKIIGNKIKATFMDMGERWLPTIKTAGEGLGHMLDTLGDRVTVFDRVSVSIRGFMRGLAGDASVRETVNAIADLLFGAADGSGAADQLGRLFETFRRGGVAVKEFWNAAKDSPIVKFLGEISGYGFSLFLASTGITLLAGAVFKLARALAVISGLSAAVGIIKSLVKVGGVLFGGGAATAAAATAGGGVAATGFGAKLLGNRFLGAGGRLAGRFLGLPLTAAEITARALIAKGPADARFIDPNYSAWALRNAENHNAGRQTVPAPAPSQPVPFSFGRILRDLMAPVGGKKGEDVSEALRNTIVQTKPTGTQDVRLTNPTRPNMPISVTVYATTDASPQAIGEAVGDQVKSAVEGLFSDGGM
jgi:TP901 family phage tail tape measure protein